MKNMRKHLHGKSEAYEVQYRIQAKDGAYRWFYDRGKVTKRDENGNPVFLAGIVFDITESKRLEMQLEHANKKLERLVVIDDLTGIYNRKKLSDVLPYEIAKFKRNQQPLSLILFDVDKFKMINDTYGHDIGDVVLKELAAAVKSRVRETDIFCRFGGDEFVIILPDTQSADALVLAKDIAEKVNVNDYLNRIKVTLSIGIAECENIDYSHSLIKKADTNLYKAKNRGGNLIIR